MNKLVTFLREVRIELSKVSWPTRGQTTQYTLIVVVLTLILAVFLGLVDFGLTYILRNFILS